MKRSPIEEVRFDDDPVSPPSEARPPIQEVDVESHEDRAARLLSLRRSIESGAYRIPAEAVARKVMERMRTPKDSRAAGAPEREDRPETCS